MIYRKAITTDIPVIHELISTYPKQGIMLPRSLLHLYECARDFAVVVVDKEIVATAALHLMCQDLAEIRSLVVKPEYQGKGYGCNIVKFLLEEARIMALKRVFALTYK